MKELCTCGKEDCSIPYGYCHCGCESITNISKKTGRKFKNKPNAYIRGHWKRNNARTRLDIIKETINDINCMWIPLTMNKWSLIEEGDYDIVGQYNWCAQYQRDKKYRAMRRIWNSGDTYITYMHRQILGLDYSDKSIVDHINRDTLDNRRTNLRLSDKSTNGMNRGKPITNTSGYKGVSWSKRKNKWTSRLVADKKIHILGLFDSPEEAHAAYKIAAMKYHGEFARFE